RSQDTLRANAELTLLSHKAWSKMCRAICFMLESARSCNASFSNPYFNCLAHFAEASFEEMVCAVDDHQLFRLGQCLYKCLQLRLRAKLIAAPADKQLRFLVRPHAR